MYPVRSMDHSQSTSRKRKRIAHACEPCRQRKSRCDGNRPRCDVCTDQNVVCFYRDAPKPVEQVVDRQSFQRLEARLAEMESMLSSFVSNVSQQNLATPPTTRTPTVSDETSLRVATGHNDLSQHRLPASPSALRGQATAASTSLHYDSVDGMVSITFADEASFGVFGPTSNSAFLQKIVLAQNALTERPERLTGNQSRRDTNAIHALSRPASPTAQKDSYVPGSSASDALIDPFVIPSERETLRLINVYFENAGRFFPYLYKPRISGYLTSWRNSGFKNIDRSQLCILNLLMALATIHCSSETPIPTRMEKAVPFVQRAMVLIPEIKPTVDNIGTIQAFLMATQYVQGTGRSSQTWDLLGKLVYKSLQVGLHQSNPPATCSALEAELRRRTWWTCFILDKLCSMTYGRPPLLPNSFMKMQFPSSVELAELDDEALEQTDMPSPSTSSLLLHTSKLYLILAKIIEEIYFNNLGPSSDTVECGATLVKVLEIDGELLSFANDLPADMRLIDETELTDLSSENELSPLRFRIILTLRYLNARMLLHRSALSCFLEHISMEPVVARTKFQNSINQASLEVCVEVAFTALTIISKAMLREHMLPIWWWSVYFAFSSALVLYGTRLVHHKCRRGLGPYPPPNLSQALQMALDILDKVGGNTHQVLRCQKIVNHLLQAARALDAETTTSTADDQLQQENPGREPGGSQGTFAAFDSNLGPDPDPSFEFFDFTADWSSYFPDGF